MVKNSASNPNDNTTEGPSEEWRKHVCVAPLVGDVITD